MTRARDRWQRPIEAERLVLADDTVPTYKGILYQKGSGVGGHGFFLTKQPSPIDYTGESGGVNLTGQPQP